MNYVFNLQPSPKDDRDFLLESIYPYSVALPATLDLRNGMPSVRDQGQYGTCSAQTAAAMKEWQERVDVNFKSYMSPQFIYNLRENYGTEGMTPRDTMKILYHVGIVPEKDYPYASSFENLDPSALKPTLAETAAKYRISGYANIGTMDSLKKALLANGPCYIAFSVYNPEKREFWKPDFPNQEAMGGHAVTVVGWLKDSFIIRNSWSSQWGDGGYTYYKFADWGMHWEVWTTIDADTSQDKLEQISCDRVGFFRKLFHKRIRQY